MASGTKQPAAVELQAVTKRYGATTAVKNVSFTVEAGTLATLLGPSGCGKTTTLRLIAGLEQVSEGTILIGDRDMTRLPATERDVSMVFQSYALFPHMTVLENVAYGPTVSGVPKKRARDMAAEKPWSGSAGSTGATRRNSRVDSSSASRWHARWCWSRWCCCSTNPCRTSTPNCAAGCARRSASCNWAYGSQ
jgi:ABC-type branched-subunit amino acid transport system ATPase component